MSAVAPAAGQSNPDPLWVRQFGTAENDSAQALAPTGDHGVLVAGWTRGSLGGPNAGGVDGFAAKYDGSGARLWLRQFGTVADEYAHAAGSDGAGGAFLGGYSAQGGGGTHAWIGRYDSAGSQLWFDHLGPGSARTEGVVADGTGGAYYAGMVQGSLGPTATGLIDAWIARYDNAGNRIWIQQFGAPSPNTTWAHSVTSDSNGGLYVAGKTSGNLGGSGHCFIARYDDAGNRVWLRQFGTTELEEVSSLAPDGHGGVFAAGSTNGSLGGTNAGFRDPFLVRFDDAGNQLWARQFGTPARDWAHAVAADGIDGVYVAGRSQSSLAEPSTGFLARFDSDGTLIWTTEVGTSESDYPYAAATDGSGGVFVAGATFGSFGGPNSGGADVWVARWRGESPCYANCDNSTVEPVLNVDDFTCFINSFAEGVGLPHEAQVNHYANCDGSTIAPVLNVDDFTCFINAFAAGCS